MAARYRRRSATSGGRGFRKQGRSSRQPDAVNSTLPEILQKMILAFWRGEIERI